MTSQQETIHVKVGVRRSSQFYGAFRKSHPGHIEYEKLFQKSVTYKKCSISFSAFLHLVSLGQ